MSTGQIIFLVIGTFIFLVGLRAFLPRAIFLFAPAAISSRYLVDENAAEGHPEEFDAIVQRLQELGYTVNGVLREKAPLWGKTADNIILTAPDATEYVAVVQEKKGPYYYFQTIFEDGRIAVTAESGFRNMRTERLCQNIVKAEDIAEVLQAHRNFVAEFSRAGGQPYREYTPELLERSTHLYYSLPESRHSMRRYGLTSLIILIILSIPFIIAIINVL